MKYFFCLISLLLILGCSNSSYITKEIHQQFSSDLDELQSYFHIPGLAISVIQGEDEIYRDYKGFANLDNEVKLESNHLFPIASLTKVFTGVAMMKLVEEGKLDLDSPLNKYIPTSERNNDSILIKHVLSHTSQGEIGEKFYYSSRFGMLTKVIEKASGISFNAYLEKSIFSPLQLQNTYLLKNTEQIVQNRIELASPYIYDIEIKKGFVDYGYSASAGIISNLEDLRVFNSALDNNTLISKESKQRMFASFKEDLPYGFGIFSQKILDYDVVWAYGQYDSYSSLFLKIPEKELTLILLANNNLLSDPARLINGDLTSSLFALSFFKNYMNDSVDKNQENFKNKERLAKALSDAFMARFDNEKLKSSSDLIATLMKNDSTLVETASINLLHNLSFLKDVAYYKELGEFNQFDSQIETIGIKLHNEDPQNPYVNMYLGTYYLRKKEEEKGKYHLEKILNAPNFSSNWYTKEAEMLLNTNE